MKGGQLLRAGGALLAFSGGRCPEPRKDKDALEARSLGLRSGSKPGRQKLREQLTRELTNAFVKCLVLKPISENRVNLQGKGYDRGQS